MSSNCFLALFIYASFAVFFQKHLFPSLCNCRTTKSEVCKLFGNSIFICMAEDTSSATESYSSLFSVFDHKQRKLQLLHMDQSCHAVSEGITRIGSVP